jgi:hypothetical protein
MMIRVLLAYDAARCAAAMSSIADMISSAPNGPLRKVSDYEG